MVVVAVIVVWVLAIWSGSSPPTAASSSAPSAAPGRRADEQQFLAGVDRSISGAAIAHDKSKYVGDSVDIACTIASIVNENSFTADCGENSGVPAVILVDYDDTVSLNKGQAVRIMGTVEEPTDGVDSAGKKATFAAVKAQFIE